ncbi:MAG: triose-phosphate isomerase [SAR86 cluster bacterium]|uniref:Triosephosphate isomerase n=1 Tax=SAR86 cluster bacterium TaxID=2030880 RepID=A0A2A5ATZ9_9GAMM|nr:MAG: triose-phosphate isomerase [SAR86 cluster bacterium]
MRRRLIVGNWKMHGSKEQVRQLLLDIEAGSMQMPQVLSNTVEIGVCPTFLHIALAAKTLTSDSIKIGAQNLHCEPQGAFTGEVSAEMLQEYGVTYVLVGHSERREIFSESDELVAAKFVAAQRCNLIPILCVGESLVQREQGITEKVVLAQLDAVLQLAGIAAMEHAVIAYEPVWAIGTGRTASPEQAQQVHKVIREHIAALDIGLSEEVRIIYGGSVKAASARELFSQADIDGGLVGGASLEANEFISICKSAD